MNVKELIEKYEYMSHACFRRVDTLEVLKDLRQLDEPQKVTVPQFVADWIEECKAKRKRLLTALLYTPEKVNSWVDDLDNQKLFARAYLDGYEVEKEKRYYVKITAAEQYLVRVEDENFLGFLQSRLKSKFTRKELEEAGFGWVFDCPGVEVEEVTE